MARRNREYVEFLKEKFNEPKYIEFINDLLNLSYEDINKSIVELVPHQKQFKEIIEYYKFIANYTTNSDKIGIFIVKLSTEISQNARTAQRSFISTLLSKYNLDASIVAFYQDNESSWRLSFVKKELNFTETGIKIDLSPAKRYSYLVGENEAVHTAQEYLFKLFEIEDRKITLSDIEKVFDVEKVTKRFFEEYKEKYLKLKEYLDSNEDFNTESQNCDFTSEEFAKKLMGQIVFLYFLQKKGWLGVQLVPDELSIEEYNELLYLNDSVSNNLIKQFFELKENIYVINKNMLINAEVHDITNFSDIFIKTKYNMPWGTGKKDFIRTLYIQSEKEQNNFFDAYVEPFFYNGLNEKRDNQYFALFNCKIPFLNGGLFEPLNNYRWSSSKFKIPNEIFSNHEKNGMLDFLDLYNFTIDEEEPLEKEIAVDPEMLGKIFENLLDVKDRKSTGSFYTPREIVHYMCQESLANYIVNKLHIPYSDIISFIKYGDIITQLDWDNFYLKMDSHILPNSIWDNIISVDKALIDVKIADPAVGSGAFPLGMLNEIVKLRDNISSYILIQEEKKLLYWNDLSSEHLNRDIYSMKLQTIQNSIYAVDLEISAIDIAKLRLWLSLIVDYPNDQEPKPLPNLDCKIMQGNSLLEEYNGVLLFDEKLLDNHLKKYNRTSTEKEIKSIKIQFNLFDKNEDLDSQMNQLIKYQKEYFITSNPQRKKELKKLLEDIQFGMLSLNFGNDVKKTREVEEQLKKKIKPWFIWKFEFFDVFKMNGGFDIVIGNPPYVGEKGNKDIFEPINNSSFGKKFHIGRMDLFYYFFHKSIDIAKNNGIISFITTNYYVTADGANILRKDFHDRTHIDKLINFNEVSIFETAKGQHNMITFLRKSNDKNDTLVYNAKKNQLSDKDNINNILNLKEDEYTRINKNKLFDGHQFYIRMFAENMELLDIQNSILNKIKTNSQQLINLCNVNQGARTGVDKITDKHIEKFGKEYKKGEGVFVLTKEETIIKGLSNCEVIKPWFKNSDIDKYYANDKNSYYVIYSQNDDLLRECNSNALNHLKRFKKILEDRDSEYSWYKMDRPRKKEIFISEKIVSPQRSQKNTFAYDNGEWFASADVYFITKKTNVDLKYILGILNSRLYYFWLYFSGKRKGNMLELYQTPLSEIPIKNISKENQNMICQYVEKILFEKKSNKFANTEKIEYELDLLIYKIYELTLDEIKYVDDLYTGCIL